jgi:hypothetical protein
MNPFPVCGTCNDTAALGQRFDWQCHYCRFGFDGEYQTVCPSCLRSGWWSEVVAKDARPWDGTRTP